MWALVLLGYLYFPWFQIYDTHRAIQNVYGICQALAFYTSNILKMVFPNETNFQWNMEDVFVITKVFSVQLKSQGVYEGIFWISFNDSLERVNDKFANWNTYCCLYGYDIVNAFV